MKFLAFTALLIGSALADSILIPLDYRTSLETFDNFPGDNVVLDLTHDGIRITSHDNSSELLCLALKDGQIVYSMDNHTNVLITRDCQSIDKIEDSRGNLLHWGRCVDFSSLSNVCDSVFEKFSSENYSSPGQFPVISQVNLTEIVTITSCGTSECKTTISECQDGNCYTTMSQSSRSRRTQTLIEEKTVTRDSCTGDDCSTRTPVTRCETCETSSSCATCTGKLKSTSSKYYSSRKSVNGGQKRTSELGVPEEDSTSFITQTLVHTVTSGIHISIYEGSAVALKCWSGLTAIAIGLLF